MDRWFLLSHLANILELISIYGILGL